MAQLVDHLPFFDSVDTTGATSRAEDPVFPCANGSPGHTIWYTLQLTETRSVSIDTGGSDYDTVLTVFDPNGDLVGCDDDMVGSQQASITFQAIGSSTYFILVASFNGTRAGRLNLSIIDAASNDQRATARPIRSLPYSDLVDVTNATSAADDSRPQCAPTANRSVWYELTAPASGTVRVQTIGSTYDTTVAVFVGDPTESTELACNDDIGPGNRASQLTFAAAAGQKYLLGVFSFNASGPARLTLSVSLSTGIGPVLHVHDANGRLGTVNVGTGEVFQIGALGATMTDVAFSATGELYGVTFDGFYQIDATTAYAVYVRKLGIGFNEVMNALVFGPDGTLYGASNTGGFYRIDPDSGQATRIRQMAYGSAGDLAFDDRGRLYLSTTSNDLVRIDPATGATALVGPIGFDNVFGLAFGNDGVMYGVAHTTVFSVNLNTGKGTALFDYAGTGLTDAYGGSFFAEAVSLDYAALGDSFSSGEGVRPYVNGTDQDGVNECHRSEYAYSNVLRLPGLDLARTSVACSGASTENVRAGGRVQWADQGMTQLDLLDGTDWDLVTITIGGNDLGANQIIGFGSIAKFCAVHLACDVEQPWADQGDSTTLEAAVTRSIDDGALHDRLIAIYDAILDKAPEGAVFVLAFPQVFPIAVRDCGAIGLAYSERERKFFRRAADTLDAKIRETTEEAGVHFVDPRPLFSGHELCAANHSDWFGRVSINDPTQESFHPNRLGQQAFAAALRSYVDAARRAGSQLLPNGLPANPPPKSAPGRFGQIGTPMPHIGALVVRAQSMDCHRRNDYAPGEGIRVTGSGFAADTEVDVRLVVGEDAGRTDLGVATADQDGTINAAVAIPSDAAASLASIEASGVGANGAGLLLIEAIAVDAQATSDVDGDGVPNACDGCPSIPDANQTDSDADGRGDACDACPMDPSDDFDGDGICDDVDPCPLDAHDDRDRDGICDSDDNCPLQRNPDQTDSDGNGRGDACQTRPCFSVRAAAVPEDGGVLSILPPNCNSNQYEAGTVIELSASPRQGLMFSRWSGSISSGSALLTFAISADIDVTATFATQAPCIGDCNADRTVAVNELIALVNIALGNTEPGECPNGIPRGMDVSVTTIIAAVNSALKGCTPTA
ncbi:MAG: GDSL-type esterase/lipase family protein [bacterium]